MGEDNTRSEAAEQLGTLFAVLVTQGVKALQDRFLSPPVVRDESVDLRGMDPLTIRVYLTNGKILEFKHNQAGYKKIQ